MRRIDEKKTSSCGIFLRSMRGRATLVKSWRRTRARTGVPTYGLLLQETALFRSGHPVTLFIDRCLSPSSSNTPTRSELESRFESLELTFRVSSVPTLAR